MFGFSIFMNEPMTNEKKEYIHQMADAGFTGIFTSMHIPEDEPKAYKERLTELGETAKSAGLDLMIDISEDALIKAGFSFEKVEALKELGVTGLRMDYGIQMEQIAAWSKKLLIALNASTLTEKEVDELKAFRADFDHLQAWHNYYPRPETGLDEGWFHRKNQWLKEQGFTVQGFVPGDSNLRGPLFEGLPTLEKHRHLHPLACALEMKTQAVDLIYIGDGGIDPWTREQFAHYLSEQEILLRVESEDSQYFPAVLGKHVNRQDEARDVIRSAEARFKEIPHVRPEPLKVRERGAVTIDNEKYLRYMGEIQLVKHDLPACEKTNVAAYVVEKERPLLDFIGAGCAYQLIEKEGK